MMRLVLDPVAPDARLIARAVAILHSGGVAAIPTDTVYGLAADPRNDRAVGRLADLKGRTMEQAVPLIASDITQVIDQVGALPPMGVTLARRFWPGPLTLVLNAPPTIGSLVTAGTGSVGVRVPDNDVARALCRAANHLLTATSANLSGHPPAVRPDEVLDTLPDVDVLIDAGPAPGGPPSTLVDVTGSFPKLIREGAVPWEMVKSCLGIA